jgi:aspartate kinase
MGTIVMKFGGSSLSNPQKIKKAADIIEQRKKDNSRIVVVVSAMGKMTDNLIGLAKKISSKPSERELDMLVSAGERISMALLAMALSEKKLEAISFTGSQSGIITTNEHSNARIIDIKPFRIMDSLDKNKIVIVAGFQGVSLEKEVTTLGRGGSDTSAVGLAVAIGAPVVEFFKDVDGIYSQDPKICPSAKKIPSMTYDQTVEILLKGSKVLHLRCVELAKKNNVSLHVLSYKNFKKGPGTIIENERHLNKTKILYEK